MGNTQDTLFAGGLQSLFALHHPFSTGCLEKKIDGTHVQKLWERRTALPYTNTPLLRWGFPGANPCTQLDHSGYSTGERSPSPEHCETPLTASSACGTGHYWAPFLIPTPAVWVATLWSEATAGFDSLSSAKCLLPLPSLHTSVKINQIYLGALLSF